MPSPHYRLLHAAVFFMVAAFFQYAPLPAPAAEPPLIPVGLDAYRMWTRWPYQQIETRAYMRSTYDRSGANEGADASHFLYQKADDFNVTLDVEGRGYLYFARYNHWHGSPWHYVVDGSDHIVQESTTRDPLHPVSNSTFIPESLFPSPLAFTWSATRGADLSWVPIGFEKSFQMAYTRTHYGTGYYIYRLYADDANLSHPITSWDGSTPPDPEVSKLIARAGEDLAPKPGTPEGDAVHVNEQSGEVSLLPGRTRVLATLRDAPAMVRALQISIPRESAIDFSRARIRVTWDDRPAPSINAPVSLFFGAGSLYNRDHREWLVKGFPMNIRVGPERVYFSCYYPMPFFHSAKFALTGDPATSGTISDMRWSVRTTPYTDLPEYVGYFHATYRDVPNPELGRDITFLDTRKTEGGGDWSGSFVGMSWIFSHRAVLRTLEGDPRFFFDDSQTPQAYGTGTEEWGGGGDYWGGRNMTLPFAGHPVGAPNARSARNPEDRIESAYRFLLADAMPFGRNARINLEHGGKNDSTEHYEGVVYWYGAPGATLVKSDSFQVGDPASERVHQYSSPDASKPVTIVSRYELGVDTVRAPGSGKGSPARTIQVYPALPDTGRVTTGTSEFTLTLTPKNLGVLLRRKLDYAYPNQRAEVYVADAASPKPDWKAAGVWYLAGSNTCVYSNPRGELGATQHKVETSNRRFRDDEFLIPRRLTEGRKAIRVRVVFTPVKRPLFPGHPLPKHGWSEIRYDAYCYVLPPR